MQINCQFEFYCFLWDRAFNQPMPILRNAVSRQSLKEQLNDTRKESGKFLLENDKSFCDLTPNLSRLLSDHKITRGAFDVVTEYMQRVDTSGFDCTRVDNSLLNSKRSLSTKKEKKNVNDISNLPNLTNSVTTKLEDSDEKENIFNILQNKGVYENNDCNFKKQSTGFCEVDC